jgi:hypothetical protein
MWPSKQASDWKFKHVAAPRWGLMSPQGWKMHQKKRDLLLDHQGPWRGLSTENPPNSVDLLKKNSKIQLSIQKNFNTSPARARACGLKNKLQTQNSSSYSDARHCILIVTNQNLNSSSAQAWPCGLARKLQTRILSSHSDARHSIVILRRKTFNARNGQAWPFGPISKLETKISSMMLPPSEVNDPPGVKNASNKKRPTTGP